MKSLVPDEGRQESPHEVTHLIREISNANVEPCDSGWTAGDSDKDGP